MSVLLPTQVDALQKAIHDTSVILATAAAIITNNKQSNDASYRELVDSIKTKHRDADRDVRTNINNVMAPAMYHLLHDLEKCDFICNQEMNSDGVLMLVTRKRKMVLPGDYDDVVDTPPISSTSSQPRVTQHKGKINHYADGLTHGRGRRFMELDDDEPTPPPASQKSIFATPHLISKISSKPYVPYDVARVTHHKDEGKQEEEEEDDTYDDYPLPTSQQHGGGLSTYDMNEMNKMSTPTPAAQKSSYTTPRRKQADDYRWHKQSDDNDSDSE